MASVVQDYLALITTYIVTTAHYGYSTVLHACNKLITVYIGFSGVILAQIVQDVVLAQYYIT